MLTRFIALLTLFFGLTFPAPAFAASNYIFDGACTNTSARGSAVCQNGETSRNPLTGSDGLIVKITRIVALVAGMAAVIIIMLSGFRYINSAGDATKATQARNGIIYALIGLIVIVSAQFIISLIVSRL